MIKSTSLFISILAHSFLLIELYHPSANAQIAESSEHVINIKFAAEKKHIQKKVTKPVHIKKQKKIVHSNINRPVISTTIIKPTYPKLSRILGEEGKTSISAIIDKTGKVIKTTVLFSSGFTRLDKSAIYALRNTLFIPAKKNNVSIKSKKTFSFAFNLL